MKPFYVYCGGPTDWFDGWTDGYKHDEEGSTYLSMPKAAFKLFIEASIYAAENGYFEGDLVCVYYSGLPPIDINDQTCDRFMVAWKQSNNGTTFFASPIPIQDLGSSLITKPLKSYLTPYK